MLLPTPDIQPPIPALCLQLFETTAGSQEEAQLCTEAALTPECFAWFLAYGQATIQSSPQEALRAAELAVLLATRREESEVGASAGRLQAQVLRVLGRHAEAIEVIEGAAERARASGNALLAAQVQIGAIDSLCVVGRSEEAIRLARQLETILRGLGAEMDAAKVLMNLGNIHYRRDQYAQALACYEQVLEPFQRSGDVVAVAKVQGNCGNILAQLNRIEEAVPLFEQARATFAAQNFPLQAAMVDANLGYLHYASGKFAPALSALSRARQEFTTRNQPLETATCDLDMGDAYRALNLHPEALESYQRAIEVFQAIPMDYERARAELGHAAIRMATGQMEEAFTALENAEGLFRTQKNTLQQAHVRLIRASLFQAVGQTEEAGTQAQQAARTFARHKMHGWAAEAKFLLVASALEADQSVTRQMSGIARTARRFGRGWLECRAHRALGRYHTLRQETRRALRHLRAGVAVLEEARTLISPEEMHVAFLRDKLNVYEDLVGLLLGRGRPQDTIEALEVVERAKSRLLLERVQSALETRAVSVGTEATALQTRLTTLRAELSRGYHQIHNLEEGDTRRLLGSTYQSVESLVPLENAYHAALREAELAELPTLPTMNRLSSVVSVEKLCAGLAKDEQLVEFYSVRGQLCAFVVSPDGVKSYPNLAELSAVNHAARRLRYHLNKHGMMLPYAERHTNQFQDAIEGVLSQLYTLLWKPLEAALTVEKVVVVPHGVLHGLPFHAFFDGVDYALDNWEFVYAPSAAVWYAGVQKQAQGKTTPTYQTALVMGVPGPGIEQVTEEIAQIAPLLPDAKIFQGEAATLEAFRTHAEQSRLLHLASHALYRADNPLFSGLRFADGFLLARDLYEMTLDCDLATLSACRTGVALVEPGDELFGLLRGFLAAGVRSLAVSLWPADDAATAKLMVTFYKLLREGASRAAALRSAQRTIRSLSPHPYHWAAFALVGER